MPASRTLLSIVEFGGYPNFTPLYENAGYAVTSVVSVRKALGLELTGIAMVAVPLAPVWAGIGYVLGRWQEALRAQAPPPEKGR